MNARTLFSTVLAAALLAGAAGAQAPADGTLLVATSQLTDRNFAESVLLMLHHGEDGSLGILVNRPTNLRPADVFADESPLDDYVGELFLGGPIGPDRLLFLLRAPAPGVLESAPVVDDVYVSADPGVLAALARGPLDPSRARIYAGHAAWGPGQLDAEIAAGSWRIVPGSSAWVFAEQPLALWRELARHTGSELIVAAPSR